MFNVILTFWLKLKKIIRSPETLSCYLQNSNSKWSFEIVFSCSMPLKTFRLVIFPYLKIPVLSTPSFTFIWLMISHLELSCLLILKIPVLETHWNKNKKQANSKNLCPLLMEKKSMYRSLGVWGGGGALRRVGRAIGSYGIKLQSFLRNCWKWKLHIRQYEFDRGLP